MSNLLAKELKRSNYRLLGLVGQGQFGKVYCASHRKTGRLVALKELDKQRFPTHRFLRELRFLLSLHHANIVNCHALEHTATGRYLVMDYCEGGTLRNLMDEDVRLHPSQALKLTADVLAGLSHAHGKGIIHCDIKPENILLTLQADGWMARISDFGIAHLSQELADEEGSNTGSPAYMAPERFYGQYSYSSDFYAVGVMLFELILGYRPFSGVPAELMSAHLNQPVKIPDSVPEPLQNVIHNALRKLPARRFRSTEEMLDAVKAVSAQLYPSADRDRQGIQLLQQVATLPACLWESSQQKEVQSAIKQIIVDPAPKAFNQHLQKNLLQELPSSDLSDAATQVVYQVFENRVGCQIYPEEAFSKQDGATDPSLQSAIATTVRLPESVREIFVRPNGCFALTEHTVHLIPPELFGSKRFPQKQEEQPNLTANKDVSQPIVPQFLANFSHQFVATVEDGGRWMVTAAIEPDNLCRALSIWNLSQSQPTKLVVPHSATYLFQLLILDSRYFAAFSHRVDKLTSSRISGVLLEVFTRHGRSVGSLNLPVPLRYMAKGLGPYQLIALEPGHPTSLLFLDLKPLRMLRVGLEITPALLTTTEWGYVLADANGQIELLNQYGQRMGRMQGPDNPTAIAMANSYELIIATWKSGRGSFQTVDLRKLDLDIIF